MNSRPEPLSGVAEQFEIEELPKRIAIGEAAESMRTITENNLKSQTLPPLVGLYIFINIILTVLVFSFAAFEHYLKWQPQIVDDRVVIALISGVTVQAAAVIIAAYKGLFA